LVEITSSTEITPAPTPKVAVTAEPSPPEPAATQNEETPSESTTAVGDDDASSSKARKRRWFRRSSKTASEKSTTAASSGSFDFERDDPNDDVHTPLRHHERESEWGLGDDARMGLG